MAAVYQAQGRYDEAAKLLQDLLKKTEKSSEIGTSQCLTIYSLRVFLDS